ncbi:hypothetical protein NDU88_001211 [Pleurodeles waltl]|uniref:Uncharacterized protein n=1 Tax=Pleurodeles waltl TaxID=8319 RepID=A0AAV7MU21_PLEWA|nr:hypothetical protein NDU88_001211 [Pleurodeles waltl]
MAHSIPRPLGQAPQEASRTQPGRRATSGLGPAHRSCGPRSCIPPSATALRHPYLCHQGFQPAGDPHPTGCVLTVGMALRLSLSARAGRPPPKRPRLPPAGRGSQCLLLQPLLHLAGVPSLPWAKAEGLPPPAPQDWPGSKSSPAAQQPVSQLQSGRQSHSAPVRRSQLCRSNSRRGAYWAPQSPGHSVARAQACRPCLLLFAAGQMPGPPPSLQIPTSDSGDAPGEAVTMWPGRSAPRPTRPDLSNGRTPCCFNTSAVSLTISPLFCL